MLRRILSILGGFVCAVLAISAVCVFTLYVAAVQWFFFVYLRSFDAHKVLSVFGCILVAWLATWAILSARKFYMDRFEARIN